MLLRMVSSSAPPDGIYLVEAKLIANTDDIWPVKGNAKKYWRPRV
jgi:hypothetical protein